MVQQNVKAQNLEAGAVDSVVGEAGVIIVLDDGVRRDYCLDNDVLDVSPDLLHIIAVILHECVEGGELSRREPQPVRPSNLPWSAQSNSIF